MLTKIEHIEPVEVLELPLGTAVVLQEIIVADIVPALEHQVLAVGSRYQEPQLTETLAAALGVILLAEAQPVQAVGLTVVQVVVLEVAITALAEVVLEAAAIALAEVALVVVHIEVREAAQEVQVAGLHLDLLDPQEVAVEETKIEHLL